MPAQAAVPEHPAGVTAPHSARPIPLAVLGFALLSLVVLGLLPFLQLGDGSNIPRFALFMGRFHPVVLHVPIGMILLAIILEHAHIRGLRRWIPKVAPGTSTFLMFFAAMSATVSTILGWMLSFSGGYEPVLLQRHFIAGLSTAIGANLALLLKLISDSRPSARFPRLSYQFFLLATGACLGLAGHWGASITHGEDYLTEFAPDSLRHILGLPVRIDPANLPWKPLPDRIAFADVVGPLLNDRCVGCHSGQKAKGGLRLDRYDLVMKGGNSGAAVVPGEPDKSLLLKYIDLPEDDEKHMPPKGKTQLSDDEQAVLAWWVGAGAPELKTIGELNVPAPVQLAMEHAVPEAIRLKQEAVQKAEAAKVAAAMAPLKGSLHGTIRLIVPGQPGLEYAAGPEHAKVDDAEVRRLEPLGEDIILLDLARTRITDAGLQSLAKMPNLTRVEIQETNTGDSGLQWIGKLAALEVLNLYDTHVSDKGLALLASMPKLSRVYVGRTKVTAAGVRSLQKRFPQLDIVQDAIVPVISPAASPKPAPASQLAKIAQPALPVKPVAKVAPKPTPAPRKPAPPAPAAPKAAVKPAIPVLSTPAPFAQPARTPQPVQPPKAAAKPAITPPPAVASPKTQSASPIQPTQPGAKPSPSIRQAVPIITMQTQIHSPKTLLPFPLIQSATQSLPKPSAAVSPLPAPQNAPIASPAPSAAAKASPSPAVSSTPAPK